MCGIVGYIGVREAAPYLIEGLRRLEYRGYDSAGVATAASPATLVVTKRAGRLDNLIQKLNESPSPGNIGIGHTRWATHGPATDINAHPHIGGDDGGGDRPQRRDRELPHHQSSGSKTKAIASVRPPTAKSSPI